MTDWQPIRTAPRDGTPILAFHPAEGFAPITSIDVIWWEGGEDNGWLLNGEPLVDAATHWMPLPDPPSPQERVDGGDHG